MGGHLNIAIVGAGITGLSAGWKLTRMGHRVEVFERRSFPGGSVRSERNGEWLLEYGPNTLQVRERWLMDWIQELGLADRMVEAPAISARRYIVRDGKPVSLPGTLVDAIRTPLFSWPSKLRILKEPFIGRGQDPEESVASFVQRRLGKEILEYAINPFVAGVYASEPERLALRHAFPRLHALEKKYGSLILGSLGKWWNTSRSEHFSTSLISFRNGLQELPRALAATIESVHFEAEVQRVQRQGNRWELYLSGGRKGPYDRVIVNIPLYLFSEQLLDGGGDLLGMVEPLEYPPLSVLHTGYRREQVAHPLDGFGFLTPRSERRDLLGALFSSTLFPERAPDGRVLLTTFVGGARQPELASLKSDELRRRVIREHRSLLGVEGDPELFEHVYWPRSIPTYTSACSELNSLLEQLEERHSGLYLGGNFRKGVSLPDCISNGLSLADRIQEESLETA